LFQRKKKGDKPRIDRSEDKEDLKEYVCQEEEMTIPA
jgi:hypothetical protein